MSDEGSGEFGGEEVEIPRQKRRAAVASKKKAGKRGKVRHEEAIEDNTAEEALEHGAPNKKIRKRDEVSDDEKQAYVKVRLHVFPVVTALRTVVRLL